LRREAAQFALRSARSARRRAAQWNSTIQERVRSASAPGNSFAAHVVFAPGFGVGFSVHVVAQEGTMEAWESIRFFLLVIAGLFALGLVFVAVA